MTKTFPGAQKPVLSDISLQFYQGAKIGIVGPNGAGKSTLIKIMAGIDTDFTGEAWPGENITVGYLEQEPELDPSKTVLENVKDGARATADMVERFNQIGMEMAEEDADFDALGAEMSELQDKIDAVDGWTLDNQLEIAMEALRCPPGDWPVDKLSGGEKAPRRADPAADPEAVDPAAGRTDQPPRRRICRMAGKPPQGICRRGADDHPRPLLPRSRGGLDPRTRSRQVFPL
ncbi:ATP-binding cassette domain-containing protein [Novosphingobium colocasiae]